jgi:hypothetical protein
MKLKPGYRITSTADYDFEPEQGGFMRTVVVERQGQVTFPDGTAHGLAVWVEVYAILSEMADPDDQEELYAIMRYNYPEAFHGQ